MLRGLNDYNAKGLMEDTAGRQSRQRKASNQYGKQVNWDNVDLDAVEIQSMSFKNSNQGMFQR